MTFSQTMAFIKVFIFTAVFVIGIWGAENEEISSGNSTSISVTIYMKAKFSGIQVFAINNRKRHKPML